MLLLHSLSVSAMQELTVQPHPLLEVGLVEATLPSALEQLPSPQWLVELLELDADAPLERSEELRGAVRKLLRHGGYRPTGRGKPASEYLVRAAGEGALSSINLAVDACNVVSLHSGLPISVVDLELATAPYSIAIAGPDSRYVFNASGQEIQLEGLLNLCDAAGPCANAVKDSQRTKTHSQTRRTLSVIWGTSAGDGQTAAALEWYSELLLRAGVHQVETELLQVGG
jgi:DNA/RNA-binding domain of Phe-tRNA-synthetase-like protein